MTRPAEPVLQAARPTIQAVAAAARVSTATVSRALTGSSPVSVEIRRRVLAAADRLGYEPNRLARSLRSRRSCIAGVLIPDIENPFFTAVVRGIEDVLRPAGYAIFVGCSDDHRETERSWLRTLRAEGVAGLVVVPGLPATAYRQLVGEGLALVALDRSPRGLGLDLVTVDNEGGAKRGVSHLASLGHRRIGFIGGPAGLSSAAERLRGYEAGLAACGLTAPRGAVVESDFRAEGGRHAMERLLALAAPPTAVFIANDLMTLGALSALHARGIEVPRQMALVGFDDASWASALAPPLTTVAQPARAIGSTAARLLLERLAQPQARPRHIVLETSLVVRASCGAGALLSASRGPRRSE